MVPESEFLEPLTLCRFVGASPNGLEPEINRAGSQGEIPGMRYRRTTVLLTKSLGSEQYHSMNSSIACRYLN